MLKTSAAALAFFLGPLAWTEPWNEAEFAAEPQQLSSASDPGPAPVSAVLPS
jgi:hypothetical protein